MDGLGLIGVMTVTGGVIAFIGDKLGTMIGKKRLSFFGLRPRHTSMIITVITGFLITAFSIGIMSVISEDARTALFGMEKLNEAMASAKNSLEKVSAELLRTQDEYAKANENLENSKKEISELKAEQEELKNGNAKLEEKNSELSAQNERLAGVNVQLEADNKKLGEFNLTLTADNKKLTESNAQLEDRAKKLRDGLVAMREGDIAFRAGEVLATGIINGRQSVEEITEEINKIAENATANIAERFGQDDDNAVWIYQPELQSAIEKISAGKEDTVLRIVAAGNLMRGEAVRTNLEVYPNKLIFAKNEFIISRGYEVKESGDSEIIVRNFLADVNRAAVARGILTDPLTGSVGVMDGAQLYGIVDAIKSSRGPIILTAFAESETNTAGPLRLNIKLEQKSGS